MWRAIFENIRTNLYPKQDAKLMTTAGNVRNMLRAISLVGSVFLMFFGHVGSPQICFCQVSREHPALCRTCTFERYERFWTNESRSLRV